MYIFLVKESAVIGTLNENPFHMQNYKVESVVLNLGANQYGLHNLDFAQEGAIEAFYQTVCRGLGITNRGFSFNFLDFQECYSVFVFDTTTTTSSAGV